MTAIAERREFFLRHVPVNTGTLKDKETGFPTKHKVKKLIKEGTNIVEKYVDTYNRFLEGDVPTAEIWAKLLASVYFKENDEISGGGGNYDEDITNLQNSLSIIGDTVASHTQSIANLNTLSGTVATLEQNIANLTGTVSTHTSSINTISNNLNSLIQTVAGFATRISSTKIISNEFKIINTTDYQYHIIRNLEGFDVRQLYGQDQTPTLIMSYSDEEGFVFYKNVTFIAGHS